MSVPKGWIAPRRDVACTGGCGITVSRSSHFATAVCDACNLKRRNAAKAPSEARKREEARRYRILMALSPYGTYEALLAAIRVRQPRTREARYDLTLHKRAAP